MDKTNLLLKNKKCAVALSVTEKEVSIFGKGFEDRYNEPAFYNKTSRSYKKAWSALQAQFTDDTDIHDAIQILSENNIRCCYYCRMD